MSRKNLNDLPDDIFRQEKRPAYYGDSTKKSVIDARKIPNVQVVNGFPFSTIGFVVSPTKRFELAGNEKRAYLLIQNLSSVSGMRLNFGSAPTGINYIELGPKGSYEAVFVVPTNRIVFIAEPGAGEINGSVTEGTRG